MEDTFPLLDSNIKLLNDVQLLIELKIRNIENETSKAVLKSNLAFGSHENPDSLAAAMTSHKSGKTPLNQSDELFSIIEQYSKALKRLKFIKTLLDDFNAMAAIELLSNDRFMLCPEKLIHESMLCTEPC